MKKIVRISSLLLFLLLILINGAVAQSKDAGILDKRITMKFDDKTPGFVVYYLATKFGIPFGIEERLGLDFPRMFQLPMNIPTEAHYANGSNSVDVHSDPNRSEVVKRSPLCSVDVRNESLQTVMDILISQVGGFEWDISDGVVNIFPKSNRDIDIKSLLDTKMSSFSLDSKRSVGLIRNRIVDLPEFRKFFDGNKKISLALRTDFDYLNGRVNRSLDIEGTTLKQLLNRITREKKGAWVLRKVKNGRLPEEVYIEFEI